MMKKLLSIMVVGAVVFSALPSLVKATTETESTASVSTEMSAKDRLEEARRAVEELKEKQREAMEQKKAELKAEMEKKMAEVKAAAELKKEEALKFVAEKKAKLEAQKAELKRKEAEKKARNEAYRAAVKKAQQQHQAAIEAANKAYRAALVEAKKLLAVPAPVPSPEGVMKNRDSRRLSDLKQLQTALELYYMDQHAYPAGSNIVLGSANTVCLNNAGFGASGCSNPYMGQVPSDPLSTQSYMYTAVGSTYVITAVLETTQNGFSGGVTLGPSGLVD